MNANKKCLILSHGPIPAPEHTLVEGGGLRCWGLAKGIKANNADVELTVAYHSSHVKEVFTEKHEGIHLDTWTNETLPDLIKDFDSIIVSYCMGDLSRITAVSVRPDQQLILDCYVPIYVEASARESQNLEEEYHAFNAEVPRLAEVLKRGDIFLCASEAQKRYYQGVLSALGRINPATYGDDNLLVVPYGIYRDKPVAKAKPITELVGNGYKKVLWFGGIYPWFDLRELVDAVSRVNESTPTKLVIVGAKNPYNTHPDFLRRYQELADYIESDKKFQDVVVMQDWVKFEDRADWYLDSDCVVVINKQGAENELAWRTRLVDFMWADLPIITNGGDPLGEVMIAQEAAFKFKGIDKTTLADDISRVLANQGLEVLHRNLSAMRPNYYWDKVTAQLTTLINRHKRAIDLETFGIFEAANLQGSRGGKLKRAAQKAKKVPAYANKYGYSTTAKVIAELVRRKIISTSRLRERQQPAYIFISHQLDMSGAPFIAIDMALEFKHQGLPVKFYTHLPAHKNNFSKLNKAGIKPHVLMSKDMVPNLIKNDTVVLNTVAHSEAVKDTVFNAVEQGYIKQIIWYLHEDDPELLFRPDERRRIQKMLQKNQITLLVPAVKIKRNYDKYFSSGRRIVLQPYRHTVPKKYQQTLKASDFSKKLTFVLPGTMGDGRKGQLPIFYAFVEFYKQFYKGDKNKYRDFELVLVGVSDDFLSRQVIAHADALKGHFSSYGKVSWTEHLEIVAKANITICYSVREALPLFVYEGMFSGHPILRNDSSGMEEQLVDGKNGYYLESTDFNQVVKVLEQLLNRNKTSDKKLMQMSQESLKIAKKQANNSYLKSLSIAGHITGDEQ